MSLVELERLALLNRVECAPAKCRRRDDGAPMTNGFHHDENNMLSDTASQTVDAGESACIGRIHSSCVECHDRLQMLAAARSLLNAVQRHIHDSSAMPDISSCEYYAYVDQHLNAVLQVTRQPALDASLPYFTVSTAAPCTRHPICLHHVCRPSVARLAVTWC
jgi:hypothetical protein